MAGAEPQPQLAEARNRAVLNNERNPHQHQVLATATRVLRAIAKGQNIYYIKNKTKAQLQRSGRCGEELCRLKARSLGKIAEILWAREFVP